jgi:preprotein translocase subunit SecY
MAQANAAAAVQNIYRTPELWDKIKFTFLCLLLYRVGAHVTVPGIDVVALTDYFANQGQQGLLGLYDLFVGGGLSRATVFALGIMPYISASIFVQIAGAVVPTVDKMQKDEEGRKKLTQWTRYGRWCWRSSRRTASRCSRRACRTPSSTRASGSPSRWCSS